jgi:type III restriction enzyme
MSNTVIENPILNSPYREPAKHWKFSDDGITDEIVEERRSSSYFLPIASPRSRTAGNTQLTFQTEWTKDRLEENRFINEVRRHVASWRAAGWPNTTRLTQRLLQWWTAPGRENRLFFCQIEALETAIFITEAAQKLGHNWLDAEMRQANEAHNPGLFRTAFKMATGSGKTIVMAMLIAWQALNKMEYPQDARFSDAFLVVTPGITIRDRLRVLLPNDPQNYYRARDLVPPELFERLHQARIVITNFHTFLARERVSAARLTKAMLGKGSGGAFTETPAQVARRVCRDLGGKRSLIIINDEAHHCYQHRMEPIEEKVGGDERREAERREEAARIWLNGLASVRDKFGVRAIFDLSATPFFLRGSGYPEGTLFPWVVSDFSLIDAIESGIVKIPRVPVADNAMTAGMPTYRDLWRHIRDHLPKKGRRTEAVSGEPFLPRELEGALKALYGNYETSYGRWEQDSQAHARGQTPPVFIIVCNNTNVSKLVYDYVAGWEKTLDDGSTILVPGALEIFSNAKDGAWLSRPNTVLIDSEQLESGEAMQPEFKRIAAHEIEEFKAEYRARFPGRDPEQLTDEDLLREVMNTVGKLGKLGEQVKCVVSVSMLTEGWDANTVTHILGVRAFGTQLLCEQVVGRGLRRTSYVPNPDDRFSPEYAEVYGVPFSFIPCSGSTGEQPPRKPTTRVRALEDRVGCEITFPRLTGYRWELPAQSLTAAFGPDARHVLSTVDVPTKVENAPIVGEKSIHTLDELKTHREQEVEFHLARRILDTYFRDDDSNRSHWLFPQLVALVRRWMAECLVCKDDTFPQLLLFTQNQQAACDRIYRSIVASEQGAKMLKPILEPYDTEGSTRFVDFDTARPVMATDPRYCHISHVVADTSSWEQKLALAVEDLGQEGIVLSYVKNQNLGFKIPYTIDGEDHYYLPDFIVRVDDGRGKNDPLNLVLEVTGQRDDAKVAKTDTARTLWTPAVNNHGGFGRWSFLEIRDPWNAKNEIRAYLASMVKQNEPQARVKPVGGGA